MKSILDEFETWPDWPIKNYVTFIAEKAFCLTLSSV